MTDFYVKFPLAGTEPRLAKVGVNDVGPGNGDLVVFLGPVAFKLGMDKQVKTILVAARFKEPGSPCHDRKVAMEFSDIGDAAFDGQSYGLALSIADYLARCSRTIRQPDSVAHLPQIIATGTVTGANGDIGRVGEFYQKLLCIEDALDQGDLGARDMFFFPTENEHELSAKGKATLRRLMEKGLTCFAVDQLSNVRSFFGKEKKTAQSDLLWSNLKEHWRPGLLGTTLFAVFVVGLVLVSMKAEPISVAINPEQGVTAHHPDLIVRYRYGGPDGRRRPLVDGSILTDHERFTIEILAERDLYLYLVHSDDGFLNPHELLSASGRRSDSDPNLVRGRELIKLPGSGRHYKLDTKTGLEQFHTLVSSSRLIGLESRYRALKGQVPQLMAGPSREPRIASQQQGQIDQNCTPVRGLEDCFNDLRGFTDEANLTETGSRDSLYCPADGDGCKLTFTIRHVSGRGAGSAMPEP